MEHRGTYKGATAHVVVAPEWSLTVVALANLGLAGIHRVGLAALNGLLGHPLDTPLGPRE